MIQNTLDCLPGMSRTWHVPGESSFQSLDLLTLKEHNDPKRCFSKYYVCIFIQMQFSAFKQLVLSKDNNKIQSEGGHFQSDPQDATVVVPQPLETSSVKGLGPRTQNEPRISCHQNVPHTQANALQLTCKAWFLRQTIASEIFLKQICCWNICLFRISKDLLLLKNMYLEKIFCSWYERVWCSKLIKSLFQTASYRNKDIRTAKNKLLCSFSEELN